jgi:hypothetical protein
LGQSFHQNVKQPAVMFHNDGYIPISKCKGPEEPESSWGSKEKAPLGAGLRISGLTMQH